MRLSYLLLFLLPLSSWAQDVLIKRNGQEIKTRIISIDKKVITYKVFDDPEFQTVTVNKKDVRMIRMEEGKVYDYDRTYPAPYIGLGGGPWIPTGRFGSYESNGESTPGYAGKGFQIRLSAGFYFSRKIGIAIEGRLGSSKFKTNEFDQNVQSSTFSGQSTESDQYGFETIMAGPMYSTLLGRKMTLDVKLMGGGLLLDRRTLETTYYSNGMSNPVLVNRIEYGKTFTLSGGLGINLRYAIMKRFSISLYGDYLQASPEIEYLSKVNDNTGFNNNLTDTKGTITRSISGASIGLSFNYQFNRKKDW